LQSSSDTGNGDSGGGTSSSELGCGVGISECDGLLSSDCVSVSLGFWDSLNETWVSTSLVKDLGELCIKVGFSFTGEGVSTLKELLDLSI